MKIFFTFVFCFCFLLAGENKQILLLHSYNKGLKWSDGISDGVASVFASHPFYELSTEYMDSKKIDTPEYFAALLKLYRQKFATRAYDALIVCDNYAYEFILEHHQELFNDTPIIFCGVENFDPTKIPSSLKKITTGVVEYKDIDKNLALIKKIVPDIKSLYIISDNSFSSLAIKDQILSSAKEFRKSFDIIFDNDIDMDALLPKINALPKPSTVLFTSLYKDKYGAYIPYQRLREVFERSIYPVFAINKIHLGEGIVGGVMINPNEQGVNAARAAVQIIEGKSPADIAIKQPIGNYYFDYAILDKYNIEVNDLPLGSVIVNKPKDFFEQNRNLIDSLFIVFPFLVVLIIILIVNIYKRISLEIELEEQSKLDQVLLSNIQSAIFWRSKENILIGCNDALAQMLGRSKESIINQKIKDIMPELNSILNQYDKFVSEIEIQLKKTAKEPTDVLIRRKQYFNKDNEEAGVVTIISDITAIKKLQIRRKKDEQFMIQRSKLSEIGEMITSIAHQWKMPLIEISAIAQELQYKRKKRDISQGDADLFVRDIMTQISYMTTTIDDFRSFIKPSSHKSYFSINKAINELLHVIEHSIKYNYIEIEIIYENDEEYTIFGYPNEFKQSLLNIINNAKDSIIAKRKNQAFDGKITLHVERKNGAICIGIKDNGLGIPTAKLESIFEPFVSTKEGGDGFGLYMVRLIIDDKMGGKIRAVECENGAHIAICLGKI